MKRASDAVKFLLSTSTVSKSTESLTSEDSSSTAEATFESLESLSQEDMFAASSPQRWAEKPATPNVENAPAPDSRGESNAEKAKDNQLLDAFNLLQSKMAACGYSLDPKLPKIAVVGPENSGKSSVLQSFVGKDFLPNGSGLVTRRPTIIQLEPIPKGSEEYGVFAHVPKGDDNAEKRFYNFEAIRQEIADETNRLLGPTEFSSEPIVLKIHSPHVLKLTLVDLPGMVENKVDDQDESVVDTVQQMVRENIADSGTIILAVCPANQPIATSVALKVAKEADPNRERTIGVLTKLDLEEAGTNSVDVLENRKLPLQRGYVGVVNRSQTDIMNGRDRAHERKYEKMFFQNSCYSYLASRMGSDYLQELLQKTLKQHIQKQLPSIRSDLSLRLARMQRELKTFKETVGDSLDEGDNFYLMNYVQDFVDNVNVDLMGYSDEVPDSALSTGAELNCLLNFKAQKLLELNTTPEEKDVTCIIENMSGYRNSISLPSLSMNAICRKLVNRFIDPLETSLLTIRDVLLDSVMKHASCMDRYPLLKNEVIYRIKSKITQLTEETREKLVDHCRAEQLSVNVGHPDYDIEKCSSIVPHVGCRKVWEEQPGEGAAVEAHFADGPESREELLRMLLQSECNKKRTQFLCRMVTDYLEIVKKNVSHVYFINIKYFLVFKFMNYLNKKFKIELGSNWASNLKKSLAQDCEEDFKRKEEMEAKCKYLEEALALIKAF